MNKRLKFHSFLITTLCILSCQVAVAQKYNQNNGSKLKHLITAGYGLYNFYDGMPIFHKSSYSNKLKLSRGFGLRYLHQIDDKNAWSISSSLYYYGLDMRQKEINVGDIQNKKFLTGQVNYQRNFISNETNRFSGSIGILLRYGSERLHGGFYGGPNSGGDAFTEVHLMQDIGLPIGIHYTYYLGKHWHFTTNLEHTFFPYVYASKRKRLYPYEWDNGTSRNMTKLSIGIGVNFGEVKTK